MLKLISIFFLLASIRAQAMLVEPIVIEGHIIGFDEKTVKIIQKSGRKAVVSRNSIPKFFKIQGGKRVYAIHNPGSLKKIR